MLSALFSVNFCLAHQVLSDKRGLYLRVIIVQELPHATTCQFIDNIGRKVFRPSVRCSFKISYYRQHIHCHNFTRKVVVNFLLCFGQWRYFIFVFIVRSIDGNYQLILIFGYTTCHQMSISECICKCSFKSRIVTLVSCIGYAGFNILTTNNYAFVKDILESSFDFGIEKCCSTLFKFCFCFLAALTQRSLSAT